MVLIAYVDNFYDAADKAEQRAFDDLLEWRDPDLFSFLLGSSAAPGGPEWQQLRQRLGQKLNCNPRR